jgi:protein-S-isoprenylcysteine O-methyltransferase Ste14
MSPTFRTVLYAAIVLGVFLGYLPWQVLQLDTVLGGFLQKLLLYVALTLFFAGAVLLFSRAYYLVLRGELHLFRLIPPQRMVVAGPYARLQHPMMLGFLFIVFAEAFWFYSVGLVLYAVLLTARQSLPGIHRRAWAGEAVR